MQPGFAEVGAAKHRTAGAEGFAMLHCSGTLQEVTSRVHHTRTAIGPLNVRMQRWRFARAPGI